MVTRIEGSTSSGFDVFLQGQKSTDNVEGQTVDWIAIVDNNPETFYQGGVVDECDHTGCELPYEDTGEELALIATINSAEGPDTCQLRKTDEADVFVEEGMNRKNGWHKMEKVGFLILSGAEGELHGSGQYWEPELSCEDDELYYEDNIWSKLFWLKAIGKFMFFMKLILNF